MICILTLLKKIMSNTLFVDIEGFPVSYENFYNSFKARGEIGDEVMNSLI